jgi:hypothetical protein
MVKGPRLREIPKIVTLGRKLAQALPMGKIISWATIYIRVRYLLSVHQYRRAYTSDVHGGIAEEEELVQPLGAEVRIGSTFRDLTNVRE